MSRFEEAVVHEGSHLFTAVSRSKDTLVQRQSTVYEDVDAALPDILKGKYIVTEVISCAAYMMHMYNQTAGPITPTVNAGGAASYTWSSEATYVLSHEGCDPTAKYMPLYRLKKPRPKFWELPFGHRGNEISNNMINRWEDVDPPWNPLDDEGEEYEIYDAVRSQFFSSASHSDDDDD
ncbi:hypothetical protein EDB19DRAFT_1909972 [Suillus lakei]|nr:hypothetical protein EDB19DRAFT_1909972 [Suillus lakei]